MQPLTRLARQVLDVLREQMPGHHLGAEPVQPPGSITIDPALVGRQEVAQAPHRAAPGLHRRVLAGRLRSEVNVAAASAARRTDTAGALKVPVASWSLASR